MINKDQLIKVELELESGTPLNFQHIARVFGYEFWQLLTLTLIDAKYSMYEQIKDFEKFSKLKSK